MIPAERAHLRAAAISHPGMTGKNNEDRYAVAAFRTEGERPIPVLFAIISDGIGGHRAGEIASEMVVETVSEAVAKSNANNPIQTLREAIMRSSQQILVMAEGDEEKKGMGATCACALIVGDKLYIAYVGDSRIYLIRNKSIQQLSVDHTWIQEAIEAGIIEPEQAKDHPNAHVIRRYLGSKLPVEPDTRLRLNPDEDSSRAESNQGLHLRPNDCLVLCSDGLTDLVDPSEILAANLTDDREDAIQKLVDLANKRGGHDNITIVALEVPELMVEATQPMVLETAPAAKKRPTWLLPTAGIAILLLLILIAASILFLFQRSSVISGATTPDSSTTSTLPVIIPSASAPSVDETAISPTAIPATVSGEESATPALITPLVTLTPWPTNTQLP
jgi:PPM family protein phosphatase